jgi:hypothetical protein
MSTQAGFVLKIFLLSAVVSLAIKYGGEYLWLEPTTMTALAIVLLPSLIIGSILGWRYNRESR